MVTWANVLTANGVDKAAAYGAKISWCTGTEVGGGATNNLSAFGTVRLVQSTVDSGVVRTPLFALEFKVYGPLGPSFLFELPLRDAWNLSTKKVITGTRGIKARQILMQFAGYIIKITVAFSKEDLLYSGLVYADQINRCSHERE